MPEAFDIPTRHSIIHGTIAGAGPPLLLLHGIPETHRMWCHMTPALAERHTVVATDLRGFGASGLDRPESDPSMRGYAEDQFDVMSALGFERFAVVGHDRGARCAYRMAIDMPERVERLVVMDIVPTGDAYERADARFATSFWVWHLLSAPAPIPERLIPAGADAFVDAMLSAWPDPGFQFDDDDRDAYIVQFRDPARVATIAAQYRAAVDIDTPRDLLDRDRQPIRCPTLVLWSAGGPIGTWYDDPPAIWRRWAADASGQPIDCGHFLPEEAPEATLGALTSFLGYGA